MRIVRDNKLSQLVLRYYHFNPLLICLLVTLRAEVTFSKSLYYSEHSLAGESSAMLTIKNKDDLHQTLELTIQALHSLDTYLEPRAFKKVSLHVSNGINPPASSMDSVPMGLTENGIRSWGHELEDKESTAKPWGPEFGSQEPT